MSTGDLSATRLGDQGPWLVLLHGLFGQGRNWTTVAKALAPDHRVLMVDLPNHGRSGWTASFSYPDFAARVADLIARTAEGPVAVVGHSMGGKTAMALALTRPELVERLVVADVSPVSYGGARQFTTFVAGMRSIDLATLTDRGHADQALQDPVPDPVVRSFLLQNLRRGPGPTSPDALWHWQMNLDLLGDQLEAIGDWPAIDAPPYPGPVLWLAGERSDYVRPQYAAGMRALFPRAQLVTVKGAGHWLHAERPEVVVATLRRFLHPAVAAGANHG